MEDLNLFFTVMMIANVAMLAIFIFLVIKFLQIASDVNNIKEKVCYYEDFDDSLEFFIHNGYKEDAKRILLKKIWASDEMDVMRYTLSKEAFENSLGILKGRYERFFVAFGEPFPSFDSVFRNKK